MNEKEELKLYMQTIRFLDESTADYLYLYDFEGKRLYFTDKICRKYALASGEDGILFSDWKKVVYSRDHRQLDENIEELQSGNSDTHNIEYRLIDRSGNKVWVNCRGKVIKNEKNQPLFLMGSISELAVGHMVDSLTGLWNVEKFMEDMGKSLKESKGYLMVLGIDNFKNINVKSGRTYGNQILKQLVHILEENSDSFTKLYRLDGDRFAVNLIQKTRSDVTAFYRLLKKEMEKYCTVSAGVVDYSVLDREDGNIIYQYAENALDRAKKEGKDKVIFFSFQDYHKSLEQIHFQDELREAVKNQCEGFYLCYQPQIRCEDFTLYGAEALLRYESRTRGVISPAEFIPLLEQSGMICQVGEWVLRTAAAQCRSWRKKLPKLRISVNVSYVQLRQEDIAERVLKILEEEGLPGNAVTLEVTESMQLQDYSYFNKIFYAWKQQGIKIAIDDFGTGYSSLSYLKSIDIDETKIDRCFVNRIYCNAYNRRLLSNMIELAHSAQMQVCCEGVETEEELMELQKLSPDVLQGFLFAKPYKKEEFEEIYMQQDSEKYQERLQKEQHFCRMNAIENKQLAEERRKDEIINIVEGMDEVIYVSDMDSYELYYMNSAGRKLTGAYDYKGCKCYKVLQGRNTPCKNCNNKQLKRDSFHMWEIDNDFLDTHFVVKDKLIPWQGNVARLEVAIDVGRLGAVKQPDRKQVYAQMGQRENKLSWNYNHRLLDKVSLGLWVIRIDEVNGRCEMYTDDTMNRVLGLKGSMTAEECYAYWYQRISEEDLEYINAAVEKIIQTGKIHQVEYVWNHPEKGRVPVRCVGVRAEDREGIVSIEGYHRFINDMEMFEGNRKERQ